MRNLWLREGRGRIQESHSVSIMPTIEEKPHGATQMLEGNRQILAAAVAQPPKSGARPHRCQSWILLFLAV